MDHGSKHGRYVDNSKLQQEKSPPSARCTGRCAKPLLPLAIEAGQRKFQDAATSHQTKAEDNLI
jgi:pSer/pThr/pTyr-binding forkhead associated (FHA) protein